MIKPILKSFTCMDLHQIADSGQCFRMTELSDMPGRFSVISQEHYLEIAQLECDWKQTDETRFEAKTFAFYCKNGGAFLLGTVFLIWIRITKPT